MRRFLLCLCALLFLFPVFARAEEEPRFPGPVTLSAEERARILENGDLTRSPWLHERVPFLQEREARVEPGGTR